jgi:DNA ligase-1
VAGEIYNRVMLFAELVATSAAVAATPKRVEKIARLAELLRRLAPHEIRAAVAFLSGELPTGRIGVGGSTLARAAATGSAASPELAIGDVAVFLGEVLATVGAGSAAARSRQIAAFTARATPAEADFLGRLLVGELRQGALAGLMSDAIAAAARVPTAALRRAAMLTGDLARAAQIAFAAGEAGLAAVALEVGRPVMPMLASTSADPASALAATGPASVEWKIDGARIQVHRWTGGVRIFTRNLNEVTEQLPDVVAIVAALDVSSLVLDGEVLGLDEGEAPHAFQDTMSRFASAEPGAVRPYFFDVLSLDGESLIDRPLRERLASLDRAVGALAVPRIATADAAEAEQFLASALAAGHEGVMIKALEGRYEAGRRGKGWRKVKPVLTLDLVVLAAEWGHGRRHGWLSNLHLGARDPDSGGFVMVGKTFKGLTDELLRWQTERFAQLAERETEGTVWLRPELVVEVALDGVQRSTRYPGGVALRFARVRRYRSDREASTASTIGEVRALLSGAVRDIAAASSPES